MEFPKGIEEVIISNRKIYLESKLSKKEFIERIDCVRAVRTKWETFDLTWYPTRIEDWVLWEGLHGSVNRGDFSNTGISSSYFLFGLVLTRPLYALLKNNPLSVIQTQIICYLAGLWACEREKWKILESQIYAPVFLKVQEVLKNAFDGSVYESFEYEKDVIRQYREDFKKVSGAEPIEFLEMIESDENYFDKAEDRKKRWSIHDEFHLGYGLYYFTRDDWVRIVEKNELDALIRAESISRMWDYWFYDFKKSMPSDTHEVDIFSRPASRGFVYVIQQGENNLYKVGWSGNSDLDVRLSSLQTANAHKLVLVDYFPVASKKSETAIHVLFQEFRREGEWFELTDNQVKQILDPIWRRSQQIL